MDAMNILANLASPTVGDINGFGTGNTTRTNSNPGVTADVVGTASAPTVSTPFGANGGNPVVAWVGVIILLLVLKFASEHGEEKSEFANVRVGFYSFLVITIVAILGINAAKWLFGTWHIPGVTPLVLAS